MMTPLIQYSAGDRPLVLSPANGFPPQVYQPLLDLLAPHYQVWLAEHRPMWNNSGIPPQRLNWNVLALDLTQQIRQQQLGPVTLVGHSLGAVLGLMAAVKEPELFECLVLVEPVFFPANKARLLRWLPWRLKRKLPIVAKTLGRPSRFKSKQAAFDFHRCKKAFANLSDQALMHYIEHGFHHDQSSELRFSKLWEAAIYASLPNVWPYLRRVTVPVIGFRAEYSNTLAVKEWCLWRKLRSDHQLLEFKGSEHLLPLTEPERVASELLKRLTEVAQNGIDGG